MRDGLAVDAPPTRNVPAIRQTMGMAEHVLTDCASVRVLFLAQLSEAPFLFGEAFAASAEAAQISGLQQSHNTTLPVEGCCREGLGEWRPCFRLFRRFLSRLLARQAAPSGDVHGSSGRR